MRNTAQGSTCGDCDGVTWEHNTGYNAAGWSTAGKNLSGRNALIRNNILIGNTSFNFDQNGVPACNTNCVITHNLWDNLACGSCTDPNPLIGTPTLVGGGIPPATWAGWKMAPGSIGKNAGTDQQDMGSTYYGSGSG